MTRYMSTCFVRPSRLDKPHGRSQCLTPHAHALPTPRHTEQCRRRAVGGPKNAVQHLAHASLLPSLPSLPPPPAKEQVLQRTNTQEANQQSSRATTRTMKITLSITAVLLSFLAAASAQQSLRGRALAVAEEVVNMYALPSFPPSLPLSRTR